MSNHIRKKILIPTWVYLRCKGTIDSILGSYGVSSEGSSDQVSSIMVFSVYDPIRDKRIGIGPIGLAELIEKLTYLNIEISTDDYYQLNHTKLLIAE
jgi:hypothetical protein